MRISRLCSPCVAHDGLAIATRVRPNVTVETVGKTGSSLRDLTTLHNASCDATKPKGKLPWRGTPRTHTRRSSTPLFLPYCSATHCANPSIDFWSASFLLFFLSLYDAQSFIYCCLIAKTFINPINRIMLRFYKYKIYIKYRDRRARNLPRIKLLKQYIYSYRIIKDKIRYWNLCLRAKNVVTVSKLLFSCKNWLVRGCNELFSAKIIKF